MSLLRLFLWVPLVFSAAVVQGQTDLLARCQAVVAYHVRESFPKLTYEPPMPGAWTKNAYWNAATFYTGLWDLYAYTGDSAYWAQLMRWGAREDFVPLKYDPDIANNHLAAYVWMQMAAHADTPALAAASYAELDSFMRIPYEGRSAWWWCDALFMAPPTFALASEQTGDPRYLDFMHAKWQAATEALLDPAEGLYYRDAKYIYNPADSRTHGKNGGKIFWSRGNGWVMAGIVRVLEHLPAGDPRRDYYLDLLRRMAAGVARWQGSDGLWRVSLTDSAHYPLAETSGTALFCYAYLYGIRKGYLPEEIYRPVAEKAWAGLLPYLQADGRLGHVQRVGHEPEQLDPAHTEDFGLGAFLLAAVEWMKR